MKWYCHQPSELDNISAQILSLCSSKNIAFHAPIGAGKTTLIKALCKQLKVIDVVKSPTFSIVNEYLSDSNTLVYHFDCYRLKNKFEALDIGIETYFEDKSAYCFIEWPQVIQELLPLDLAHVFIQLNDQQRIINLVLND